MLQWFLRIERIANWFAQKYYLLATLTVTAVLALILLDTQLQFAFHSSSRWINSIGKGLGGVTANLALFALGYFLLRETYVASLKRKVLIPSELVPYVKSLLSIVRLFHPLVGVLAISVAVMHGYITWVVWGGLNGGIVIASGLITLLLALLLGSLGWGLQRKKASIFFRQKHKIIAFLALLALTLHKVIAG